MCDEFYVYVYLDPRKPGKYIFDDLIFDHEPFYVGKGKGDRFKVHLYESVIKKSKIRYYKIKKIRESGVEPIIIKLYENLKENISFNLEKLTIKKIGRKDLKLGSLINLSDGGEGESGVIFTDKHKKNISASLKISKKFQESKRSATKLKKIGDSLKRYYETHKNANYKKNKTSITIDKIKKTLSVIYEIKTPQGDIIKMSGSKNVHGYFRELNEEKKLTGKHKISPAAILYKNGSKGYNLYNKSNDYRNMSWSVNKRTNKSSQMSHRKLMLYTIKCPDDKIEEFQGRNEMRKYFNELNIKLNLIGSNRISYEGIINNSISKNYILLKKERIN